jgi:hypothetical protein
MIFVASELVTRFKEREELRENDHLLESLPSETHTIIRQFMELLQSVVPIIHDIRTKKIVHELARLITGVLSSSLIRVWSRLYGPATTFGHDSRWPNLVFRCDCH